MFKKILATSLAILTLSASGTMVHGEGEGLGNKMESLESLSLYEHCVDSGCINLIEHMYSAELEGNYSQEYANKLSEAKNSNEEYIVQILEEINYFLGLCRDDDDNMHRARRIKCFLNIFCFIMEESNRGTAFCNGGGMSCYIFENLREGSPLVIDSQNTKDLVCFFPLLKEVDLDLGSLCLKKPKDSPELTISAFKTFSRLLSKYNLIESDLESILRGIIPSEESYTVDEFDLDGFVQIDNVAEAAQQSCCTKDDVEEAPQDQSYCVIS